MFSQRSKCETLGTYCGFWEVIFSEILSIRSMLLKDIVGLSPSLGLLLGHALSIYVLLQRILDPTTTKLPSC